MTVTQRVALVVGVAFVALACWAAFVPAHSKPYSCGAWPSPKLTDSYVNAQVSKAKDVADQSSQLGLDTSDLAAATQGLVDSKHECDDKLGTRQTLTWVGVGGLVLGPIAVLFLGGEFTRRRPDPNG